MRRDRREKEKKEVRSAVWKSHRRTNNRVAGSESRKGLALTGGREEFTHATNCRLNLKDPSGEKVGKRFSVHHYMHIHHL